MSLYKLQICPLTVFIIKTKSLEVQVAAEAEEISFTLFNHTEETTTMTESDNRAVVVGGVALTATISSSMLIYV